MGTMMTLRCGSIAVVAAALIVCLDARQFEPIPLPPMPAGAGTITGGVLDFSGQPAAGAKVSIAMHSGPSLVEISHGYERTRTVADKDGRFGFTNVTAESVELRASMECAAVQRESLARRLMKSDGLSDRPLAGAVRRSRGEDHENSGVQRLGDRSRYGRSG